MQPGPYRRPYRARLETRARTSAQPHLFKSSPSSTAHLHDVNSRITTATALGDFSTPLLLEAATQPASPPKRGTQSILFRDQHQCSWTIHIERPAVTLNTGHNDSYEAGALPAHQPHRPGGSAA